ncbi:subtilisin-like protease SBT2.4 [Durio zibethinus]|uniref:Subtilisin-like protease SBT2.4 n=1 Tax=Durio zibethinus TaxID=66656 RepID=A0A6P5WWY6_DURZI|nr:subtilisin-like protease SBT2.4 [Durio zibethinus]
MANGVDALAASRYAVLLAMSFMASFAEERSIYLVLMEGKAVAFQGDILPRQRGRRFDPTSEVSKVHAKKLEDSHNQVLQSTLETGSYNKLYSFKHVLNGFAVHTSPSQAKKLKHAPGVKLVERDRRTKLMTTYSPEFLGLPEGAWKQDGGDRNAGEGIVIGFIDTGINPLHPSFSYDSVNPYTSNVSHFSGACETGPQFPPFACNGKIVSARFFIDGAQKAAFLNATVDIPSPMDAVGHGSHVASTAAGNAGVPVVVNGFYYGRASGMAPRARIAVYKAVYPTVGTLADVVAAIDQAIVDGVDILTLSIGPDEPPQDTVAFLSILDISMLFAQRAGIFVVQAAGNEGPGPSTILSYSPWTVGAAASRTNRRYTGSLLLGNGQNVSGVGLSAPTLGNGSLLYKLVLAKDAVNLNGTFPRTPQYVEECQCPEVLDPNAVRGSIVICTFSAGFYNETSTLTAIIETARTLGFMGFVLVANPSYGDFIAQPIPSSVSGTLIPKVADAKIISQYYEQQTYRDAGGFVRQFNARAAIADGRVASFDAQAPMVSRFSSRGPDFIDINRNPADVLKPDILAPGQEIWAAWSPMSALDPILSGYNFALLSGTSMAAPHVAGIAALIKQKYPSWTPSMIASAISTTATKFDKNGGRIMAEGFDVGSLYPSTYFDLGAGFVNPSHAMDPGLVLSSEFEDYISFLCSMPNIDRFAIRAATGVWCSKSLGHPANLNIPSVTISALRRSLTVRRSFKNVAAKPETYKSLAIPPNGTTINLHPPWFTIAPDGTQDLDIEINVTRSTNEFSFGEIILRGSLNHIVSIPLSIRPVSIV